ncbi:MAG: class I SAM-dependent rRNA methyltransferase [Kiritimatiellae bacterium]|nr:class I SAM-dependent rRNA methyltransferase [Kiritimatiellia bacterium]
MAKVVLKKGRERSLIRRHPWIFSGAIESADEGVEAGGIVEVVSAGGATLGFGAYSPASQIRVRMLSFGHRSIEINSLVRDRVFASVARRSDFFVGGYTDAVRLINAESDLLPGVVVDFYAGWAVCQMTSAFADRYKDLIADAVMTAAPGCMGVSERLDVDVRAKEGLVVGSFAVLKGEEPPELIEIKEGNCKFLVDVRKGHKTGFYLDQREARAAVGALATNCEVLNCFSYTGGFGVFARANGAEKVTQVDISGDALALAKKNAELLGLCHINTDFVEADVFKFLRSCRDENRTFDLIVLDPPKFAESKSQVMKAARGYKDINLLAMKLLRPGGHLATFSCSGAMTGDLFDKILMEAAEDAGRDFQIVSRTRQAADHPVLVSFPEGLYLKGVILRSV